jgi:hypothetical protein
MYSFRLYFEEVLKEKDLLLLKRFGTQLRENPPKPVCKILVRGSGSGSGGWVWSGRGRNGIGLGRSGLAR